MNEPTLSSSALEVLAIAESSEAFRSMMEKQPELRALLIEAANASGNGPDHARLTEVLTVATSATDKRVDAICRGDSPEFAKWSRIASAACEDLGRLLKELCPWATPIESNALDVPS